VPLFWFIAGVLSAVAALILILPWLRTIPRASSLPTLPWQAGVGAVLVLATVFGLYHQFGTPPPGSAATAPNPPSAGGAPAEMTGSPADPAPGSRAGSMSSAIANLQVRLAKGGGTSGDWELLAKSYEFVGRPDAAAKARAHELTQLPPEAEEAAPQDAESMRNAGAPPTASAVVSGEVSLAQSLRAKASAGATLFVVAKSVDAPGAPVAVFRATVSDWPVKFTLDDSQSMLPGRNLSSAGRVTIEARISQRGQALPAAGDLQGTSGVIDPSQHQTLKILIDHVVT
jgi:hypothetical protein